MPDWSKIEKGLDSTTESEILQTLEDLVLDDISFDESHTRSIIPKCLSKLQHHDIKIRSNALAVVATQMREDNTAMVYVVDDLGKALALPNLLDLKDGAGSGEVFVLLHKDLIYIIGELQKRFPGKLMPNFTPICNYLVQAIVCKVVDVATAACQYWANLKIPKPVPPKYLETFLKTIHPKLQKLLPYLINAMEYQQKHVEYLKSKTRDQGSDFRPKTSSKDLEEYVSRRNYAAMGLENICRLFLGDILNIFKMNLLAKMKSNKWEQVEAGTLALGAFTEALGTPKEMQDVYGEVINVIVENLKHPNSLVRSISFFTLQKFTNNKLKGVKNPLSRILKGSLNALNDESMEVQEMALRCLATILAYSEQDLQPNAAKIKEALSNADVVTFGDARPVYYECIGHYFNKLGNVIDAESAEELSQPLINEWSNLGWSDLEKSNPESVMYLCQSLTTVAMFSKLKFATHNASIFDKALPFLNKVAEQSDGQRIKSEPTTILMISFLDVISAIFQGQPSNVEKLIKRYYMDKCVLKILSNNKFEEPVHQGAMALLGYICEYSYESTKSHLQDILDMIDKMIESKSDTLQINALWCLTKITKNVDEKNDRLILMANKLGQLFMNVEGEEGVIVNSALALTNIGVKWTDTMLAFFIKEDIFVHLFALMHVEFEQRQTKEEIFSNLLHIYTPNVKKIKPDLWVHFCIAASLWKGQDEEIANQIKDSIKNVRSSLGTAKWNNINGKLGRETSANLRKRFKLY